MNETMLSTTPRPPGAAGPARATTQYTRESSTPCRRAAESGPPYGLRVLGSQRTVPVSGARLTVGTGRSCGLVLADPYVSRLHCTLERRDGTLWVRDEGSRNGTWVNDVRVDACVLTVGARVLAGRSALQLVGEAAAATRAFGIVGQSPQMRQLVAQVERCGGSTRPVLILGETGTGKELVARALHLCSACRCGPYEPLNCGAIPRELAEAELFGHVAGAFTGATRDRRGAFERADGGTLFLDEVGEMPLELQAKLLRVLEEGQLQRLGEEHRRQVAVRLIAATHRDLAREAERGRFRLDLYHRLAVMRLELPPLRARPGDISLLVRHFLRDEAGGALSIDDEALSFLERQPWRGNVRELRNVVERAVFSSAGGGTLRRADFALQLDNPAAPNDGAVEGLVQCLDRPFHEIQREVYLVNLRQRGGNRSATAATLQIAKSTFFDQLRALGIDQPPLAHESEADGTSDDARLRATDAAAR